MNPEIFKVYDIRGVYPEELNKDDASKISRTATWLLPGLSSVWKGLGGILHWISPERRRQEQVRTAEMLVGLGKKAVDLCKAGGVPVKVREQIALCCLRASLQAIDVVPDESIWASSDAARAFAPSKYSSPSAD